MVAATSKDSKTLKKAVFFMCSALHVSVIWLLQPRAIIVGLMISTPFLVFRRIKIKASQLILIAGVLLLTLFVFTPTQNNRFLELKSASNYDQMNGASQRLVIFKCTLEQLKEKPFFGLGLGSTSKVIGSCFSEKTNDFSVKEYNTHNQYLDLWLTASPLSLLLFCLFLWMVFNNLIKSRRKALVSVVLLLTIAMFFENILERQTGVILFYFLVFLILDRSKKTMFTKELLIGPLAPPITGLSVSNKQALETFSKSGKRPLFINTAVHTFRERQGAFRLSTLFRFSRSFLECYKIACAKKVYFTPGQTFLGVLKYAPFILISRALGKQLIVHIHGNYIAEQYAILKGLKKKAFYFLLSLSHKGIVLSKSLKHNLLPFIPAKDIFILPNFYDHRLLLKQKEKTFSSIKICFLSNLMNEKGINVFLKALKMLSSSGVSFEANIGGHIDEEKADQLKEKINNIKNTTYHGIVKGPQKQKILQEANIFVLPTFYKMEGLPISIIEAMATGNVIITTLHAAIPDLINQEENGFYVEKKSATQIAKKIKQLAKDPEKMKKISTNNIKKAKKLYKSKIF
jgi:glycosyltransferase involved in cell wall biosynthesis